MTKPTAHDFSYAYLHQVNEACLVIDHRLSPDLRACLCAMASRMPRGGIVARYYEILLATLLEHNTGPSSITDFEAQPREQQQAWLRLVEPELTERMPPARVKKFFNTHVRDYGHSSPLELTGSPSVFVQGVSPVTCYYLFDGPLVAGQEFSTRAGRRRDWPMAVETKNEPKLADLHDRWLEIFDAEVEWWKTYFSDESNRKKHGLTDDQPFRPALDRARWAIPSTISTGCSQTGHLRQMARIINDVRAVNKDCEAFSTLWNQIAEAYEYAQPCMKGLGLKEAVAAGQSQPPAHLVAKPLFTAAPKTRASTVFHRIGVGILPSARSRVGSYLDPAFNHVGRIKASIPPSWGVARDWHRHRTFYPWTLQVYVDRIKASFLLHPTYEPNSAVGREQTKRLLVDSYSVYEELYTSGRPMLAMCALPLGAQCRMTGYAGLRDAIYTLELRSMARGKNIEYAKQAEDMIADLKPRIADSDPNGHLYNRIWPDQDM